MRFYLKYVNPAVSLVILALCTWASISGENHEINLFGIIYGYLTSYFFAKGLFCSSALFISGKTLLEILNRTESKVNIKFNKMEIVYIFLFTFAFLGLLSSLFIAEHFQNKKEENQPKPIYSRITNPNEIKLSEISKINASEYLRITGKILNNSSTLWDSVYLNTKIFIAGVYSGEINNSENNLKPNESRYFILSSGSLLTRQIKDSINYKIEIIGVNKSNITSR